MLLNTRPRVFWITLLRIAMLLQDGARAFAPPPQALQWRPAACAVSARGGQRGIGTLRAGDLKNGLPELQPTSFHAHQDEVKPAAHTRRFWRLMATVGAALALSVSTPAPAFAKGGGGASGGGGGHFHSRSYSRHDTRRASRSSDVGVFLEICADGDAASEPVLVALSAAAGAAALLDSLDSTATARAPSRPTRSQLTEGERRSWVMASTPLSSHAAQTRSAKGLS